MKFSQNEHFLISMVAWFLYVAHADSVHIFII
jgi:hypothetical protein